MTAIPPIRLVQRFDVTRIRQDFPILSREVHGKRLVFLDSAASAQISTPSGGSTRRNTLTSIAASTG